MSDPTASLNRWHPLAGLATGQPYRESRRCQESIRDQHRPRLIATDEGNAVIYSDDQFEVSSVQVKRLKAALSDACTRKTDQTWLQAIQVDALKSQITDIEGEMSEYQQLRHRQIPLPESSAIDELPKVLAKARIWSGISQDALASRLDTTTRQIQRFEESNYMGVSLDTLLRISRIVEINVDGILETAEGHIDSTYVWGEVDEIVWGRFPYQEMIRRKWFESRPHENPLKKLREYFFSVNNRQFQTVYNRRTVRRISEVNEYALLAWQIRVLELAQARHAHSVVPEFEVNDTWLPELVSLTQSPSGPLDACKLLAQKGIVCVIEKHLPGSHLDGAAMLYDTNRPVIGLTLRHDRLDNFWFVLFHEIGHIFLHLFGGGLCDYFDTDSESYPTQDSDHSSIEDEADQFALNTLIPSEQWKNCMSRFALSDESVQIDAENLGIGPSIIAGRIRHEQHDYRILTKSVGQGQVRSQLKGVSHGFD